MHPQLAAVLSDFARARARLLSLVDGLPDDRWAHRADPARWSVAECVEHLNVTARAYLPVIRAALAEARAIGGPPPARYRRDLMGWLVTRASGPMLRVGGRALGAARTPAAFEPAGPPLRARVLADFAALQDAQEEAVRAADGLPLARVRVTSPFDARVRYNLFACLAMLPGHQHRHLEQAERVWAPRP